MPSSVNMGAQLTCSFGVAPSNLVAIRPNVLIEGKPAATISDTAPMVNVPPFAMCQSLANPAVAAATAAALGTLTPMPCTPLLAGPWKPGAAGTLIGGQPALAAGSTAQCVYGGVITITSPGTMKTQVK